jgi:HEAT repeat protein
LIKDTGRNAMTIESYIEQLDSRDRNISEEAYSKLLEYGANAVPDLLECLEVDGRKFRVIRLLGEIGAKETYDRLMMFLEDEDFLIRTQTLDSLFSINKEKTIPYIINGLENDAKGWVRRDAAELLGNYKPEPAVMTALRKALQDDDLTVRISAAGALGRLGNKEGLQLALAILENEEIEYEERDSAAEALGDIGDASALPYLEEYHEERCVVARAMKKIRDKKTRPVRKGVPSV